MSSGLTLRGRKPASTRDLLARLVTALFTVAQIGNTLSVRQMVNGTGIWRGLKILCRGHEARRKSPPTVRFHVCEILAKAQCSGSGHWVGALLCGTTGLFKLMEVFSVNHGCGGDCTTVYTCPNSSDCTLERGEFPPL